MPSKILRTGADRKIRRDVLELLADEINGHRVGPLASFMTFEEGRPALSGMSKGNRWDLEREQRDFERWNKAELKRLMDRRYRQKPGERAKQRERFERWLAANLEHFREVSRRYRKRPEVRAAARAQWPKKYARIKADPARMAKEQARAARHAERVKADPVLRASRKARNAAHHARIKADPVRYAKRLSDARAAYRARRMRARELRAAAKERS